VNRHVCSLLPSPDASGEGVGDDGNKKEGMGEGYLYYSLKIT